MAFQFFDSSSLVKKYINETGTNWVRNLFNTTPAHEIYVSRITEVEATAAIVRRKKGGSLSASDAALALQQLRNDFLIRFRILMWQPLLRHKPVRLPKHTLYADTMQSN